MCAAPGSRTVAQADAVTNNMTVEILEERKQYRRMRRAQMSSPPQRRPAHHRSRLEPPPNGAGGPREQRSARSSDRRARAHPATTRPGTGVANQPAGTKPCARNDAAVCSPPASSAVLLAVASATTSDAAGCGGVAAVVASFLVDHRHQRDRRTGRNIEHDRTRTISSLVDDQRTAQHMTGRFG